MKISGNKIRFVTSLMFLIYLPLAEAQVKITDGSVLTIDSNSLLELESTNKGVLVPRIAINDPAQTAPLTSPVPTGMLVYSSGGFIPDGFCFWNGTRWISLGITEFPVTKSADGTLLKSETFVLASGDITLTLPVVTVADNGLSITVKNIGTHLNLIIIAGNSGATIDGSSESNLTRWAGQTYTAWDGNWITRTGNEGITSLEVGTTGSFSTIEEVIEFLNVHMIGPTLVNLGAGEHEISSTQTIDLPFPITFKGLSFGETTIDGGVSGSPLFICETESYFKMLTFNSISNAPGTYGILFTGSGEYHEVKDAYFIGFNKGIVTTSNNDLWIFEVDFEDCSGAGLEIAAGTALGGSIKISESDFLKCSTGIKLESGIEETVSIINCTFYNTISGTDIGILYNPASFTFFLTVMITNNGWNNEGTFMSGFDFSRSDGRDANAFLISNVGMEDAKPHFKINVVNNALTTNLISSGTYYKVRWTNNSSTQNKWSVSDNRCTYLSTNSSDGWAVISGNLSTNSANRVITVAIVKNGVTTTRYGETSLRVTTSNQPFQFSTVIFIPDIAKDDYFEVFATSNSNGDIVTFQDVHWFTNTQ